MIGAESVDLLLVESISRLPKRNVRLCLQDEFLLTANKKDSVIFRLD